MREEGVEVGEEREGRYSRKGQTSQKENPYCVWLLAASNGDIYTAGCQCIGDDGGCKHVVALLFAVAAYIEGNGNYNPIAEVDPGYTSSDMEADMLENVVLKYENPVILDVMKGYTPPLPPPSIPELVNKYVPWRSNVLQVLNTRI
ncbi:hypothetical protein Pcinc_043097 [Petrolisthes cinctipes]|uniref:SWIM-type domain-containing protein n=1 Tax=Petrolisthes cinctipes TaxID=88211 RepID=A0AAE1EI77_PETCI|nr:hypothetical protein Pcinc_043097 [Petrolisthes cinctipes]